jgi:hypothetical protein
MNMHPKMNKKEAGSLLQEVSVPTSKNAALAHSGTNLTVDIVDQINQLRPSCANCLQSSDVKSFESKFKDQIALVARKFNVRPMTVKDIWNHNIWRWGFGFDGTFFII